MYTPYQVTGNIELGGNPPHGASAPTLVYLNNVAGWKFAVGDEFYFTQIVPHDWEPEGNFTPELHWYSSNTTAGRYVRYQIDWRAIATGEAVDAPGQSGTIDSGDILLPSTPTVANTLIESVSTIAGSNLSAGDHLTLKISRIASAGTAPAAGDNPVFIHMEMDFAKGGLGTF